MLTPPKCCIQVALSINRATCCFDTSTSRYPACRVWGSVVHFWRKASTNGQPLRECDRHNGPRGIVNWRKIPISLIATGTGVLSAIACLRQLAFPFSTWCKEKPPRHRAAWAVDSFSNYFDRAILPNAYCGLTSPTPNRSPCRC